jgi:uncharacterized small protein (DUF1192 family)
MSITKVLTDKDTAPADKLERVAEIVAQAREAYGNADAEISAPMINTVHLEDEAKVALLRDEVARIKARAVEMATQTPGANMNRKIEELLATNGMFVNIAAGTKFEYI